MKQINSGPYVAAYADVGAGPAVILAHCSSASHKMWSSLIEEIRHDHHVLAPDLLGYGKSSRLPDDRPADPAVEIGVLCALAHQAEAPVHLVGHSYGAMLCLEAAMKLGDRVRALTLIEPVSFHLLRPAGEHAAHAEVKAVADSVVRAMARGEHKQAAHHYMSFWLGRVKWWLAPAKLKGSVIATIGKVAQEFAFVDAIEADPQAYARIDMPVRLIMGSRTRRPAKAVIAVLEKTLPDVHTCVVEGAGHMCPITHKSAVNALIRAHVRECGKSRHSSE